MMPPVSYIVVAVVLVALSAACLYATHMYAIFFLYWAFSAAAFLLAVGGAWRIAGAVGVPSWVGPALLSPGIVWLAGRLRDMFAPTPVFVTTAVYLNLASAVALSLAAMACIRLIEAVTAPSGLTRAVYVVLALSLLVPILGVVQYLSGATWLRNAVYLEIMSWVRWPLVAAKYGALIAAPVVLVVRRKLEYWTLVPVIGLALFEVYGVVFPRQAMSGGQFYGVWFWLKPVAFFIGAAGLWRLGTLLRSQRRLEVPA
jgi:hypothetical protein